jgi:tRNA A-37 threonylcarbamoyl transferase component Bud32/cytochrome c-type biogenesis protein CcmH/NrfG
MRDRLEEELSEHYTIERELGQGGMATVWLAHDRRHDRRVAIKVLHEELAGAIGVDRFVREIRLTARLQHPSILTVLDSGVLPATATNVAVPWYAMSYVDGESLRARLLRETQLPIDESVRIATEVAGALHAAHQHGIVHRDVKPENVLLADARVYVVDFGIARALSSTGDEQLTASGLAIGTPVYMSPEQAMAAPVDARSDQYSLAAILYEMLVGEPPVTGPNTQAIIARRLAAPARPLRTVRPSVPESLESAVLRALERVPADRYADMAAFTAALGAPARVARTGVSPWSRRSRAVLGAVSLVALALVIWATAWRRFGPSRAMRDPEIATLYRRAMRGYDSRTPAGAIEAVRSLNAAIARDSSFALGWVGLAKTYTRIVERQFVLPGVDPDSTLRLAVASVDRAKELDDTNADTYVAEAAVQRKVDPTDDAPSIRAARRAIALDSTNPGAWHYLALDLAETRSVAQGIDAWRHAVRVQPTYTQGLTFLSLAHYWLRQYDSAQVYADSVMAIDPNYLLDRNAYGYLAVERGDFARALAKFETQRRLVTGPEVVLSYAGQAFVEARSGDTTAARATQHIIDSLTASNPRLSLHEAEDVAKSYAALGDVDGALRWLARYPVPRDLHFQLHLRCEPPLAVLARDARYRALLLPGTVVGAC